MEVPALNICPSKGFGVPRSRKIRQQATILSPKAAAFSFNTFADTISSKAIRRSRLSFRRKADYHSAPADYHSREA